MRLNRWELSVLGLGLSLAACSGSVEPKDKDERVDADQDGVFSDEDCDDSDASVRPGAADVWYDGSDSDCGGNDDFDADADGARSSEFGGGDCDDRDPEVNPLAVEVWYDGVDQDCDVQNDDDADRDGVTAAESGGLDCDDQLAAVRPGVEEVWYDGVDQNCDGEDDDDADGDGFLSAAAASGDDCDDFDAAIRPDAVELWYDGVDQDCLGDDDFDADQDGYRSLDGGGTDCEDEDGDIFPGTLEQLDGRDSNCDGRTDRFTVEEDFGSLYNQGTFEGGGYGASVTTGDFNGDGFDDLAVLQFTTPFEALNQERCGAVYVWDATDLGASGVADDASLVIRSAEASTVQMERVVFLDDIGGPSAGRPDLAIGSTQAKNGLDQQIGAVWIFRNRALELTTASLLSTTWRLEGAPAASPTLFGQAIASTPDIDGDGLDEVLVGAPGTAGGGAVHLFMSSTLGPNSTGVTVNVADADATWTSQFSVDELGYALAGFDYDDDGRGDLLVGAPGFQTNAGAVYIVTNDLAPAGGDIGAAYDLRLTSGTSGERAGEAVSAGDFDGDGGADVAVGVPRATLGAGKVLVAMNTAISTRPSPSSWAITAVSSVNYGGTGNSDYAGKVLSNPGDVNGDGKDDLFIGGPGADELGVDAGAAWLITQLSTGNRALADVPVSFIGGAAGDRVGSAIGLGDFDGDGLKDVVVGVPGEDLFGDEGAVVLGFSAW